MKPTHKSELLRLLSDGRPHHMRECLDVAGFRYGGRLHELRRAGHTIETHQLGVGEFEYRLVVPVKPRQGVLV